MKNEKKVAFQSQRIAELEKQVEQLESENKVMSSDIARYKRIISAKEESMEILVRESIEHKQQYEGAMHDVLELRAALHSALNQANSTRDKYEKEMEELIKRVKHRK